MGDFAPAALGGVAGLAVQHQMNVRDFKKREAERQAKLGRIQADEVSAALASELTETLGNIDAALASAGRDPTSPTAAALRERTTQTGLTEIGRERASRILRIGRNRRQSLFEAQEGFIRGTTQDLLTLGKLAAGAA